MMPAHPRKRPSSSATQEDMTPHRVRRSAEEARRAILAVAEKHLAHGGPAAVRVQVIAREVGISDAGVHHHFGNRQGLLEALIRHAARSLRAETTSVLEDWNGDPSGLHRLADGIAAIYADRGYARLALWLSEDGWKSRGSGIFEPLVDAVHRARLTRARLDGRVRPKREDAQFAVAMLNLTLSADPLMGSGFLRSVQLPEDPETRARFRRWLVRTLVSVLLPD